MQKVLVAEIGSETTVVNAFGDLDSENPRLLGQGLSSTTVLDGDIGIGLKLAVNDLEKDIGPIDLLSEIPFYAASSLLTNCLVQDINALNILSGRILSTSEAIVQAAQLIYEEVGDVLVLDVGGESTNIYSVTSESLMQRTVEEDLGESLNVLSMGKLMGENIITEHYGEGWERLLKSKPETPEEMALSAELIAATIKVALKRHCERQYDYCGTSGKVSSFEGRDLTRIRWIVGTGVALTQLPNGLDVIRESIKEVDDTLFPKEGIATFLDKDSVIASLGVLAPTFRQGAWQLLRESFGVEN